MSHFSKQLSVGLITAVYKSGNKSDMCNYRGLTVGSVIAKLFAMILDHRIAVWAEDEGIKAKGKAGFRKDFRTTDNIFVLKSLIDKQTQTRRGKASGKLYCCFVDFKKAFDTVPRGLLWQVLERVGPRGPILDCIKSLYARDSAAVRNSDGISEIFDCLMGVKQGCPLSATVFGLFVDGLEQHLMDTVGHDAPSLSGVLFHCYYMLMSSSCLQQQQGCRGSLTHCNISVIKGNSASIWPRPKWSRLDQKLHVKLSCSIAMKWSEWSHASILGLDFMRPKIWYMASRGLSLLQKKRCIP